MSPMPGGTGTVEGAAHGTVTGYTTHGCRCEACRSAKARYSRERRAARASVKPVRPDGWPSVEQFRAGMEMWDAGYRRGRDDALALAVSVVPMGAARNALRDLIAELRGGVS